MLLKLIALSLIFSACTQKYQTYQVIKKAEFEYEKEHTPVIKKMYPGTKEVHEICKGQFLFFSNAQKENINEIPRLLDFTCNQSQYILNATVTERWWTTLFYSRSCIKIEASCPVASEVN